MGSRWCLNYGMKNIFLKTQWLIYWKCCVGILLNVYSLGDEDQWNHTYTVDDFLQHWASTKCTDVFMTFAFSHGFKGNHLICFSALKLNKAMCAVCSTQALSWMRWHHFSGIGCRFCYWYLNVKCCCGFLYKGAFHLFSHQLLFQILPVCNHKMHIIHS